MKIEILNPIVHDGAEYARGVHELPEALGKLFLTYKHAAQPLEEPRLEKAPAPAERDRGEEEKPAKK